MTRVVGTLGIIVGMQVEQDLLDAAWAERGRDAGRAAPLVACAAADARKAEALAKAMIDAGAGALMSFGLAGGLDPALAPGTVVLATAVVAPSGERLPADAAWRAALRRRDGMPYDLREAPIAGSAVPVMDVAGKAALFAATKAAAVDMESHAVAAVAAGFGLPFMAIRAVADPAGRAIPGLALLGLGPDGEQRAWPVVKALLRQPLQLPALLRLKRDSDAALEELGRVARLDLAPVGGPIGGGAGR